jgi:hypothetical protein
MSDSDARDTDEIADVIEIALRIRFEIIIDANEDIPAAKKGLPLLQPRREIPPPIFGYKRCEIVDAGPYVAPRQFVERIKHVGGFAEGADYLAIGKVGGDSTPRLG